MRVQSLSRLVPLLVLVAGALAQGPVRDNDFRKPLRMGRRDNTTFVGIVTDSRCGAKHQMADKSAEECARACHQAGASYALVAGDNLYMLKGREKEVAQVAGQKARVSGTLSGTTIAVKSVTPAP